MILFVSRWPAFAFSASLLVFWAWSAAAQMDPSASRGTTQSAPPKVEAATPARRAPGPTKNYRLQAGDIVQVEVFQEPDMTTQQRLSQDGSITVSLIGQVEIGGKTVEEASRLITAELKKGYFINPQVTLGIIQYGSRRFTVLGQVNRPGAYNLPNEQPLTLPEAIAMAGGNTRIGELKRVTIERQAGGKIEVIKVNAKEAKSGEIFIREGDTIKVPESFF